MNEPTPNKATIAELRSRAVIDQEPLVVVPSSWRIWVQLLAAPTIWLVHFLVVYFLAEHVCADVIYGITNSVSESAMRVIIYVVTAVGVTACAAIAYRGWAKMRAGDDSMLWVISTFLAVGSAVSILLIGIIPIWVGTC